MIQTVEAIIEIDGQVRLLGEVVIAGPRRALVTVLEEAASVPEEGGAARRERPGGLEPTRGGRRVVSPAAGDVVLVRFPFSDSTQSKVRPAVCLGNAGRGDWISLRITSNPYGDPSAVALATSDFSQEDCSSPALLVQASCLQPTADSLSARLEF